MEAQLASYLVNGAFISAAGAACVYIAFASCFPKRNPTWAFWAYFFCKGCAMAYFDATRVLLPSVPVAAYALATVTIGVATYVVLYFTWKTEVLKIGIVGTMPTMPLRRPCGTDAAIVGTKPASAPREAGSRRGCRPCRDKTFVRAIKGHTHDSLRSNS